MEVTDAEHDGVTVVMISGRVDSATAPKLDGYLKGLINEGKVRLVLNLADSEYMSSAGLRTLVSTLKASKNDNGDLRLCNPSPRVAEVMRLAGLNTVFTVYGSEDEAIASFAAA